MDCALLRRIGPHRAGGGLVPGATRSSGTVPWSSTFLKTELIKSFTHRNVGGARGGSLCPSSSSSGPIGIQVHISLLDAAQLGPEGWAGSERTGRSFPLGRIYLEWKRTVAGHSHGNVVALVAVQCGVSPRRAGLRGLDLPLRSSALPLTKTSYPLSQ